MANNEKRAGGKTVTRGALGLPQAAVERPKVGAAMFQLAVPIIDVSPSMENGKLDEATAAVRDCHAALAVETNDGAFYMAVVAYGSHAAVHVHAQPAKDIDRKDLAPKLGSLGDSTNITEGLTKALTIIEKPLRSPNQWSQPVVILFTDGVHMTGDPLPETVAPQVKAKALVLCIAHGSDADLPLLERLATTPQHAMRISSGADLRKHFLKIARSMSISSQSGQNLNATLLQNGVLRSGG